MTRRYTITEHIGPHGPFVDEVSPVDGETLIRIADYRSGHIPQTQHRIFTAGQITHFTRYRHEHPDPAQVR